MIVAFIDEHRHEFGVEPICRVLQVAPSTYYSAKSRTASARAVRDAVMVQVLMVLWVANRKVYGAHKLWKAARRAGHDIGRDQVARLMRQMGIEGVSRQRRKVFTTRQDPDASRAPDLVNRNFTADGPDQLWVTDLTYVCVIVEAFSRIFVGWRVASDMRTDMVLDALEMARRLHGNRRLVGLVAHSDAGSQIHLGALHGNISTRSVHARRSGPSPTATTPWAKTVRPSASTARTPHDPGTTSATSNSPPSPGCTGSTTNASTATAATSHPSSSKQPTTLPNKPPPPGSGTNSPSLQRTQGGSTYLHLDGFVHLDRAARGQDRASFRHCRRFRQVVGRNNRVAPQPGRRGDHRTVRGHCR